MAKVRTETLPLGFRFQPTDEELMNHYLRLKINGRDSEVEVIPEVDVCKVEPWDLPGLSVIKTGDPEWFFFCPLDRKYPNGHRSNRATEAGYWKATGKDRTIKSRKHSSNPSIIGMKKTLVFYKGRAPKGDRTHWIMHEYRPTEVDLDGTHPGQAAFVLCRLFRKSDDTLDVPKYGEVEVTGLSPSMTKSSPGDASSDLFQESLVTHRQVEKQPGQTDKSENMTVDDFSAPIESCRNTYFSSVVEYHNADETTKEMYPLPGDNSNFYEYNAGQISSAVLSPFESMLRMKQGPDSPFDLDFGNDQNGLIFRDGTVEQDAYLTELLEEVFNNESYGEEFVEQKDYDRRDEPHFYDKTNVLSNSMRGNVYDGESVSFGDIDTEIAQMQCQQDNAASEWSNAHVDGMEVLQMGISPHYFQSNLSFHDTEARRQNIVTISDDFLELDPLFDDSKYIYSLDIVPDQTNSSHFSGDYTGAGGTGIKIRTRQPSRRPGSESFVSQGIAPRRIRLQMEITERAGNVCGGEEESETKSTITEEITDESKETSSHKGVENDDEKISLEPTSKLRRRMKSSESSSHHMELSVISDLPAEAHRSKTRSSSLYIVFYICILALLVFAFVLIYVKLNATC